MDAAHGSSNWLGCDYLGSDAAFHYFQNRFLGVFVSRRRLAVARSDYEIVGVMPFRSGTHRNVSLADFRASRIDLTDLTPTRAGWPQHHWNLGGDEVYRPVAVRSLLRAFDGSGKWKPNLPACRDYVDALGRHAAWYPPRFVDSQQRQQAIQDAADVARSISFHARIFIGSSSAHPIVEDVEIVKLQARLAWYQHNLDVAHCRESADRWFEWLFRNVPGDPEVRALFGCFLASVPTRLPEAFAILREPGLTQHQAARRAICSILLVRGPVTDAHAAMQDYLREWPDDVQARAVLTSLEGL